MIKIISFLFLASFIPMALSSESCSRTATINYQEVLIDSANSLKGEGLRPYLSKDATALSYLDTYQQNAKPSFKSSFMGTTGVLFTILSFTVSDEHRPPWNHSALLTTGLTLIVVNFIFNQTLQRNNEANLDQAIDEYNQRNVPKIEFNPEAGFDRPLDNVFNLSFSKAF